MQVKKTLAAGLVAFLGFSPEVYGTAKNYNIQGQKLAAASSGVIYRAFEALNTAQIAGTSCNEEQGIKNCVLLRNKNVDGVNSTYGISTASYAGSPTVPLPKILNVIVNHHNQQKSQFFHYQTFDDKFDDNTLPVFINLDIDKKIMDELMEKDKELARRYMYNPGRDYTLAEKVNAHRGIIRMLEEIVEEAVWNIRF